MKQTVALAIAAIGLFAIAAVLGARLAPAGGSWWHLGPFIAFVLWIAGVMLLRPRRPAAEQLVVLGLLAIVEGLLLAPLLAFAWDVAPELVCGAAVTSVLACAVFTARAVLVPSPFLEPFDLLVAPAALGLAALVAMPLCHLGLGFLFVGLLCALPGVYVLGLLVDHFATLEPRTTIAAAQSLLLATTMMCIDLLGAGLHALR